MSSDEYASSEDYGRPARRGTGSRKRGRGGAAGAGRRAKRNAGLSISSSAAAAIGGPSKVKLKVRAGGHGATSKRSARGGFVISTSATGKDANVPPQWQGYGDRELDSDTEEPLVFEESFILRMPIPTNMEQAGELQRFTEMVKKREPMDEKDVWFKFLDSRRAVFNLGQTMYNAKLVDLPCLVESQKTIDGKHMFKTADISQMLLVEHQVASEQDAIASDKPFNIEDYIYPHGLTPPLRHVRRRRFKPQLNKQAIEITERQVERLLELDQEAEETRYEMVDESEIQEDDAQRTQAQYQAEFAGIDMDLDPALMGNVGAAAAAAAASNGVDETDMQAAASTSAAAAAGGDTASLNGVSPAKLDGHGNTTAPFEESFMTNGDGETSVLPKVKLPRAPGAGDDNEEDDGSGEDDEDGEEYNEDEEDDDGEDSDAEGYDSDLAAMIEGGLQGNSSKAGSSKAGAAGASTSASAGGAGGASQGKKKGDSDASGGSDEDDDDDEGDSDDLFGKGRSDDEDDDDPNLILGDSSVQDNEETLEAKRRIRLMADEMKDLEKAVSNKKAEFSRAPNPMLKKRFGDVLNKLQSELELKKAQHQAAQNRLQAAQNEIKRQEAEEHAAANPQAAAAASAGAGGDANAGADEAVTTATGAETSSKAGNKQRSKADPSVVFGASPEKSRSNGNTTQARAGGDSMQMDGSRSQSPPQQEATNSISVVPADDDIAVSSKDYAVPALGGNNDVDNLGDDLFGDGDD